MNRNFIANLLPIFVILLWTYPKAQSNISFECKELNISKSESLTCDPMSEDDPNDLAESYSYLITYFPANNQQTDQRFELHFPAKIGNYHWTQSNEDDKNDSLAAYLVYNTNPKVYGYTLQAYPKDFIVTVTRYDAPKGGTIEGTFNGMMQAYLSWKQQTVSIPVKGTFRTTRTGKFDYECRKQRRSEKEVISKAVKIFDDVFPDPLQKMGWQITEEKNGYTTQIANNPAPFRPIFMCSDFFGLKLSLDPNSDYGKMLQDSIQYYNQQVVENSNNNNHKAVTVAVQNMFRLQTMQTAELSIAANSPYLKENYIIGAKDKSKELRIRGVAYAWQLYLAPTGELEPPEEKTMLFFGNWKGVNMHSGGYTKYPFIHKQQSPFIENCIVTIEAPAVVANKIIESIDWTKLNNTISK